MINIDRFSRLVRKVRDKIFRQTFWIKLDLYQAMENVNLSRGDVGISRIIVLPFRKTIHVFIWLHRPGIFIGRKGDTLYKIQDFMSEMARKEVKISLVDFDPFD